MKRLLPFITSPAFRHGAQLPWAGTTLRDKYGKAIPDDLTGESLEVSSLPGLVSRNADGVGFDDMIAEYGEALTGHISKPFPLLLKLIDAREKLSVQVHPDDAYAAAHENGKLGKTEAWVVLDAKLGARLVNGLVAGVSVADFRREIERMNEPNAASRIEGCLNSVLVSPGDVFYIPSGTIHSIGEGILVYEIQQSSDITYRLWDWGRIDNMGNSRPLHIKDALAVMKAGGPSGALRGATIVDGSLTRTIYIADKNFALERLTVKGVARQTPNGTFSMLTALEAGVLTWDNDSLPFKAADTIFVPASAPAFDIQGNLDILKSYIPDRAALSDELGADAPRVAGLDGG